MKVLVDEKVRVKVEDRWDEFEDFFEVIFGKCGKYMRDEIFKC